MGTYTIVIGWHSIGNTVNNIVITMYGGQQVLEIARGNFVKSVTV